MTDQLIVDPMLCRDCQACMLACSLYHEGENNPGLSRVRIIKDMEHYLFEIIVCHHCQSPDCLTACPSSAIRLDEHGTAILYTEECVQCGACLESCSYEAIIYYEPWDRYLKCDLCQGRAEGPACVQICPVGAITVQLT